MIEAVNSVVANASVLRGVAEQASAARSYAANPERVQEVVQAPYVSPYISIDVAHNKAVLQIRDGDTGDVLKQYPSEAALDVISRQIVAKQSSPTVKISVPERAEVQAPSYEAPQQSSPAPAPAVNAQAQVAAEALSSTAAQAQAVSAPPSSGNIVVTA